ncbi:MAG: nucleotide exchange factor GrpE [Caulobacteraceae bacterium]|nr:nucleotide exchange factor GrpE [Caulobacter sp.]
MDETSAAETEAPGAGADETARLVSENAALKEQVLRVAADAENAKRRAEKEVADARAYAIQRFARDLLDPADNLSRALLAKPAEGAEPALKQLYAGVEMTERALQAAFQRNGLKQVNPDRGARFDPHVHQAMMEQPAEGVGPGAVTAVMQPGYELFGRIVRPAMVAVTPRAAGAPAADGAGASVDTRA